MNWNDTVVLILISASRVPIITTTLVFTLHTGILNSIPTVNTTITAMLRTVLISVICVLVMMSVLTFVLGVVCSHCFSQRWRQSADKNTESPSDPITEPGEDLELKENVAYITIHPK